MALKLGDHGWLAVNTDGGVDGRWITVRKGRIVAWDESIICLDFRTGFHGTVLEYLPKSEVYLEENQAVAKAKGFVDQLKKDGTTHRIDPELKKILQ